MIMNWQDFIDRLISDFRLSESELAEKVGVTQPAINNPVFIYRNYDGFKTFWNTMVRSLGVDYTIHQLRKTCGTTLANAGVELFFLHKYLRHTDIKTTLKYYVQTNIEKMKNEIDKKAIFG